MFKHAASIVALMLCGMSAEHSLDPSFFGTIAVGFEHEAGQAWSESHAAGTLTS
jgi:hypothetical protein